jgi:hypothetical protein
LLWIFQGREKHDLLAEAGARGQQRGEAPADCEFVDTPEGGDDVLAHGPALALVLDNLEVAARARLLQAKEHGALQTEHHDNSRIVSLKRQNMPQTWHYIPLAAS